jgi:hypothetical protein
MDWLKENPGLGAALIAAVSAVIGGIIAAGARFLFDFYLSERLKRRWQTIETKRKYSSPIIHAVDDLAGRIDNLHLFLPKKLATQWLRPLEDKDTKRIPFDRYYYASSIYSLARMIAWIEILRREQIFLDFSSTKETRQFNAYLSLVYAALTSSGFTSGNQERGPLDHWIYFHYLSGIAEAITKRDEAGALRCLTLQEFCREYQQNPDSDFRSWMKEIERMFVDLSTDTGDLRWNRLQILWFCLDCFLDFVDPKKLRTTRIRTRSKKIPAGLKKLAIVRGTQLGLRLKED